MLESPTFSPLQRNMCCSKSNHLSQYRTSTQQEEGMRGKDEQQLDVFSYISPEQRVPHDHPLRPLRVMTDEALKELQPRFNKLYAKTGRPSIAPEKLLRALLLQALYSVRSERMLMEQLDYNLLFRWFVGLNMDDPIWDVTVRTGAIHRQGVSKSVVYTFAGSELL